MGAIVSRPGACRDGAVSRHQGAPGGSVFDRAAGTYGTVGPDFFGHFGRRLVDWIGIPQGGRVVDLACGTGAALVPVAEAVGAGGLSVGLDLSEAMLRRVDAATDAWSGPPILLVCMDAQQLAVRSESFDAVVCSFALGSFPDPLSALSECWRVAHSGGRLGLVVSDRWWWEGDERWSWHSDLLVRPGTVASLLDEALIERVVFDGSSRVIDLRRARRHDRRQRPVALRFPQSLALAASRPRPAARSRPAPTNRLSRRLASSTTCHRHR
jgi:SAM-dependent methyltransferase